ncbi:Lipopolysaccharide-induced tumor necrosis factor-alpha factor [Clonorchis sinensis]|uniref:Lipopolysaccharide-induced tumor necrosis factor-alpha factor n=2 Tax=Clonorchis sinensis TaxID=79923 RepID=A0A8T1M3U9_CLOSI|nr:Lipopolysaccharide-induced tumor necrosis factor-alpha factor [Clonorchis sinensis]
MADSDGPNNSPPPYDSAVMNSVTPSAPSPLAFQTTPYPVDGIGTQFPQAQYAEGANDSPPDYIKSATAPYQDERDSEKPDPTKLMTATNQSDIHQQDPLTIFSPPLGPDPVLSTCPICRQNVETKVEYTDGSFTWLLCGLLSMFGLAFGCCLLPFFCQCAKNVSHSCPNCGNRLGVYHRL